MTSSKTASVMLATLSCDRSTPNVRARWDWISRTVIPPAYNEMIMSGRPPPKVRSPLGTSRGSNEPVRSRGVSSGNWPTSLRIVFDVDPLREFPDPCPAGSPLS